MPFLTRWFGVTETAADRDLSREQSDIAGIVHCVLAMQSTAASQQHRPLRRGTHAKGTCARAQFEVFDLAVRRDPALAARLAKGIFAKPGVYPAIVRFANADSNSNRDFKPDVRALSFSVDLTCAGSVAPVGGIPRQDFSLQNARTLPINDSRAFLATVKVMTAAKPASGLLALSFDDKRRVIRTLALAQLQELQKVQPYQHLRYWSNTPFRHGSKDVAKFTAIPSRRNPARPLDRKNPNALQDDLIRHLSEDSTMSSFDFGIQLLDADTMTYWGKRYDADFWVENASVRWKEEQAPFHMVARLTLESKSQLSPDASETAYFDVTGNSSPESAPVGSINRARRHGELASRQARLGLEQPA